LKSFYIDNHGCAKNQVDAEEMAARLESGGWHQAASATDAELVIINTCGFIRSAVEEAIRTILEVSERKKKGQLQKLFVVGCFVQRYGYKLRDEMPEVDGFDILEHLQNNPNKAIVPALVLSSSEDPDDIRTAYKLGAFSYFVKPYKYDELCDLIKTLSTYWQTNKTPQKDQNGRQIDTKSEGKLGARYSLPN